MNRGKQLAKRIAGAGLPIPGFVKPIIRGFYYAGVWITETLVLIRKWVFVEPVLRSLCRHAGKGLRADRFPYIRGRGHIRLGDDVNLSGRSCFYFMSALSETPEIRIGSHVFVGNGCTFSAGRLISIGDHCLISAGVRIHDNDGHPLDAARRMAGEPIGPENVKPVTIEDGAWLGAGAVILKGVTVGRNAIVGAGAVVTRDVPSGSTVAGNPAKEVSEK